MVHKCVASLASDHKGLKHLKGHLIMYTHIALLTTVVFTEIAARSHVM